MLLRLAETCHHRAVASTSFAVTNHTCCPHPCSLAVARGNPSASISLASSLNVLDRAQLALFFKHAPQARLGLAYTPKQYAAVGPCRTARYTVSFALPASLRLVMLWAPMWVKSSVE